MKVRIAALLLVLAIYGVSLLLPAMYGGETLLTGMPILVFGWILVPSGQCFAWLANPLFALALLLFLLRRYQVSGGVAILAALVGLDTFRVRRFPPNEAYEVAVDAIGSAFYVWEASFLVLAAIAFWLASVHRSSPAAPVRSPD